MGRELEPDEVMIQVDSPTGLEPDTVRTRPFLDFLAAYLDLLNAVADEHGGTLELRGVVIENKCVALVSRARESSDRIREYAVDANRALKLPAFSPSPLAPFVHRARQAVRDMDGAEVRPLIRMATWEREIAVRPEVRQAPPVSHVALRCKLIRVGGVTPVARFEAESEMRAFTLSLERGEATRLAQSLYRFVDIEATVWRDADGLILRGSLHGFRAVDDETDAVAAFDDWYAAIGRPWEDAEDIVRELGEAS